MSITAKDFPVAGNALEKLVSSFHQDNLAQPVLSENIQQRRKEAFDEFTRLGFPSTLHEEWKYTSVLPLVKAGFYPLVAPRPDLQLGVNTAPWLMPSIKCNVIALVNGFYEPSLSTLVDSSDTLRVNPLFDGNTLAEKYFAAIAQNKDQFFVAANTALARGGVCIEIPAGKRPAHPVHLLHITDSAQVALATYERVLLVIGEQAEAGIIETWNSSLTGGFCNAVTEVSIGKGARLRWTEVQADIATAHLISMKQFELEKEARFESHVISLKGSLLRNNLQVKLKGERSEALLNGLYLVSGQTHADHHTVVDHTVPNCHSNELYKGVLDGEAKGVFNGKVFVRPDAQKTNAFQSNKNILLSPRAEINTKPQLEIFADDVKCSHGATIGRLDETAMFYLRSRGLSQAAARKLLTLAFATEVIEGVNPPELKEWLGSLIEENILKHEPL